jgi:hypothetical protein
VKAAIFSAAFSLALEESSGSNFARRRVAALSTFSEKHVRKTVPKRSVYWLPKSCPMRAGFTQIVSTGFLRIAISGGLRQIKVYARHWHV